MNHGSRISVWHSLLRGTLYFYLVYLSLTFLCFFFFFLILPRCVSYCQTTRRISHNYTSIGLLCLPAFSPVAEGAPRATEQLVTPANLTPIVCTRWCSSPSAPPSPSPAVSTILSAFHRCLQIVHPYHLSRFHIHALICSICFSLSDFV